MIGLGAIYGLAGATFAIFAVLSARERRYANAAFQVLIAASFLCGDRIGDTGNGVLVLVLVAIAASGRMRRGIREDSPEPPRGSGLFVTALIIPATALIGTVGFKYMPALIDSKQATLVALALGVAIALAVCQIWLRPAPLAAFREGRRLMDDVGWAGILPQMLASLGAIFAASGVGDVVGGIAGVAIPNGSVIGAVIVYALGMAAFTMVMGNAFAAFPVMASAIGIPLLIHTYGGDPARVAAIGMLAGFCGTLMTPMAANYNLVPAALLDLKSPNAVIRAQIPSALPLLLFNIVLLWAVMPAA